MDLQAEIEKLERQVADLPPWLTGAIDPDPVVSQAENVRQERLRERLRTLREVSDE